MLPHGECGLDVIARVGRLRYREHCSAPEIQRSLQEQGLPACERTVGHLMHRYEELVSLHLADWQRLHQCFKKQGQIILAIDGLQPDVGHEVLWVIREVLSGEILLARALFSSTREDLAALLTEVKEKLALPIDAVISDGQLSIRHAVASVFPDQPHQLCHFHYLREAAKPIYEADRHAKKELKKQVRVLKVTRSYEPHLFFCYQIADLPRTNNALEQAFGSVRTARRRVTGRRGAFPAVVVRGPVRVTAAMATRLRIFTAQELVPRDVSAWRALRAEISSRQEARCKQLRFRKARPLTWLIWSNGFLR